MKAVVASSEDEVKAAKLMQTLAKEGDMEKILQDIGTVSEAKPDQLDQLRDVTAEFLESSQPHGPELPPSPIHVYKGLIRRLAETSDSTQVGVLAGRDDRVQDVILGPTVLQVMENPDVISRWKDFKYEVLGMVSWCEDGREECEHQLQQLWDAQDHMLVLVMAGMESTKAWLAEKDTDSSKLSFRAVSVTQSGVNRQKGDNFVVLPATQVAVTLQDQAPF